MFSKMSACSGSKGSAVCFECNLSPNPNLVV